ncbi:MAG: hypothetical protein AAF569_05420 [Pseudomonadota bacterium]
MFKTNPESGNVIFLILIAVALFAALSFAVTESTRTTPGDTMSETRNLDLSQLTQYVSMINLGMTRLQSRGFTTDQITFCNGGTTCDNNLASQGVDICRTGENCLFAGEGGGVIFQELPRDLAADQAPGPLVFVFTESAGSGLPATIRAEQNSADTHWITRDACLKFNEELGVNLTAGSLNVRPDYESAYCVCDTAAACVSAGSIELYYL